MTSLALTHTEAEATTCRARGLPEASPRERGSHSSPSRLGAPASPHPRHCRPQATPTLRLLLLFPLPRTGISNLPAHHLCLQIKFYRHTATLIPLPRLPAHYNGRVKEIHGTRLAKPKIFTVWLSEEESLPTSGPEVPSHFCLLLILSRAGGVSRGECPLLSHPLLRLQPPMPGPAVT